MSTVQRIARGVTLLIISNVVSFIPGLFVTMYVACYLGVEGFVGQDW
jgi:O-antigen/teichoic acid export membrane protein